MDQNKAGKPDGTSKPRVDDEEEDAGTFDDYTSLSPSRLPSVPPEKADQLAQHAKGDAVGGGTQRSDKEEPDVDEEIREPPKLLMKEKKKSKGIGKKGGVVDIEERGRTIEDMGGTDGHEDKKEDQYDLKIREIEGKIKKRKEE